MECTAALLDDGKQRTRIRALLIPALASAIAVGLVFLIASFGYFPFRAAVVFAAMAVVSVVAFYVAICSGFNLRFSDPNLAIPELLAAGTAVSYVVYEGAAARPGLMTLYFLAFMFGVLTLDLWRLVLVALYYAACYAVVVGLSSALQPDSFDLSSELLRSLVFLIMLAWFSGLGGYISKLKSKIKQSREQLIAALRRTEFTARIDGLTECFNRRHILELLSNEAERVRRGGVLTICLVDIDNYKSVNDSYGHAAGDEVLKEFSKVALKVTRHMDAVGRYGGDEFLILLTQTSIEQAEVVAERLRTAVAEKEIPGLPAERRVTVSIGLAAHSATDSIATTLARADAALYEGKHQGRNRIGRAA